MTYFSKFPNTVYEFGGKQAIVKDILRRAAFLSEYKPYTDLYMPYTIVDGDTPQSLGNRFYGASTYHWIILMFNEIHNPYFEWPLETVAFETLCAAKYGDAMYMTRHYEIDGLVVGEIKEFIKTVPWITPTVIENAVPVSFYEFEEKLNNDRRIITIMRPELLGDFVSQFEEYINV